jgi:hypothetical protein
MFGFGMEARVARSSWRQERQFRVSVGGVLLAAAAYTGDRSC